MTSSFAPFPFPKAAMKAGERDSGNTPLTGNPSSGLVVDILSDLYGCWVANSDNDMCKR
jgi:hypothetical protein